MGRYILGSRNTDKTGTLGTRHRDEARHGKGFEGLLKRYFADELAREEFNKKLESIAKKLGL